MTEGYGTVSNDPRSLRSRILRWGLAVTAVVATAGIFACEGDNAFGPNQGRPQVSASISQTAVAGDTLSVDVTATAPRNVASITVSLSRAATGDTTFVVTSPATTASHNFRIHLPDLLADTLLVVRVTARDVQSQVSAPVIATIKAIAPPAIVAIDRPDSIAPGSVVTFRIRAIGLKKITRLLVGLRGAATKDTIVLIPVPAPDVTQSVALTIPANVQDTVLTVIAAGVDEANLQGPTAAVFIPLRIAGPTILSVTSADTISPGGTIDFRVVATSLRQVQRIVFSLRGAVTRDSTITINPPQTNVTQDVSFQIPATVTDSTLTVRITAFDRTGGASAPTTKVLTIRSGAPTITLLQTPDSAQAGRTFDLRVSAAGNRPITSINISLRGAVDRDIPTAITPPATNVTRDLSVLLPDTARDTLLVVRATATDQAGVVSAIVTRTIRVRDASAPTVTANLLQSTVGTGGTISLRVIAQDNVSLAKVGFLVLNANNVPIDSVIANTNGSRRDTTFAYVISPLLTPTTLKFQGLGVDRQGLRGLSVPVTLGVVDSVKPIVDIQAPATASTFPSGDSVLVRVRVADISGIKSIQFSGVAIRRDSLNGTQVVQKFTPKSIIFPQAPQTVLPKDTVIVRYLNAVPDSVSEPVTIIVSASDSVGNVAADSNLVTVGGPRVEIRTPANGSQVQINTTTPTLAVRVFAIDRTAGIDSLRIDVSGAVTQNLIFRGIAADSILKDTVLIPSALGNITINATAFNRRGVIGRATPVVVTVVNSVVADTAKPSVSLVVSAPARVELDDSIRVTISATDNGSSGVKRLGLVVFAQADTSTVRPDTLFLDSTFTSGITGTIQRTFNFRLADFPFRETDSLRLPRKFTLQVHAFAVDTVGNCGASVTTTPAIINCDTVINPSNGIKFFVARGLAGQTVVVTAVAGSSKTLPSGGNIADAVVDTINKRLYLSNQSLNKVDVLQLNDSTFRPNGIPVGSEPWGMFINNGRDTLIVANSGGTNISYVPLNTLTEDGNRRLLTPNDVLFNITIALSNGFFRLTTQVLDFSDRPQFIAQDNTGKLLFSTKPTGSAPSGTIRVVNGDPAPGNPAARPESKILLNDRAFVQATDAFAIAYIDSVRIIRNTTGNDLINLYDHIPGLTGSVVQSGFRTLDDTSFINLRAAGSDVVAFAGRFDAAAIGLSDTTFVAASGDRGTIAFGEGNTSPTGRVFLWDAGLQKISDDVAVQDLVGNASERVLGVGLDQDGRIGVARGVQSTYFFSNDVRSEGDLRLQGVFSNGVQGGNGGAALHPNHTYAGTSTASTMAFAATANQTIKVIDTFHFNQIGEIPIRDNIAGQLRASLALPGENGALASTACNYIVAKLYGVTTTGSVVIVNLRNKDLDSRDAGLPSRTTCTP